MTFNNLLANEDRGLSLTITSHTSNPR